MRSDAVLFCVVRCWGCWGWGCGFSTAFIPDGGGMPDDDVACTTPTFSSQLDTCDLPPDDLIVSETTIYNTTTHAFEGPAPAGARLRMFDTLGKPVEALVARHVLVRSGIQLRAIGAMPFAIVAGGTVMLENGAAIDVSDNGAGALAICSTPAMAGATNTAGGGGGGGGGFSQAGGAGGPGGQNAAMGGTGSSSIRIPLGPWGGCPGAPGGAGSVAGAGGEGGRGGGGLYIVAREAIQLGDGAVLNAGGGGGRGGAAGDGMGGDGGGGGGGGGGGMIFLEAPRVIGLNATVAANGGGGGEGGDDAEAGNPGQPGRPSSSRADGGNGAASSGADGGDGGSVEAPTGESVTSTPAGGGGGGGGGCGYVRIATTIEVNVRTVSPAAYVPP